DDDWWYVVEEEYADEDLMQSISDKSTVRLDEFDISETIENDNKGENEEEGNRDVLNGDDDEDND
ncbi:hypothetical protein RYX36_024852, partial [Vicia faba]